MAIGCATAPATPAGVLVQSNAEVLAGVTIVETLAPGAPTFYGACSTTMDLRIGPRRLRRARRTSSTRRPSPSWPGTTGCRRASARSPRGRSRSDWQAGLENGLSGLVSLLAGADMLSGAGLLYAARVFALEEMVLDAEVFGLLRHLAGRDRDRRRGAGGRRDRGGWPGRQLPRRGPHDRAHARAVAAAPLRPRDLGGLGGRRSTRRRATAPASGRGRCWPVTCRRLWRTGSRRSSDRIVAAFAREAGIG